MVGLRMAFSRLAQLTVRLIRKMWQASLVAFAVVLLGASVILSKFCHDGQLISSLALGVILWLLPNCYFVIKVMRHLGRVSPGRLLHIFYRAELIKLLLSGFFFIMLAKLLSINFPVLLSGYLVAQLTFWLLLSLKSKEGLL
jgi:F0F1-type ATP synthase assembly protein I